MQSWFVVHLHMGESERWLCDLELVTLQLPAGLDLYTVTGNLGHQYKLC